MGGPRRLANNSTRDRPSRICAAVFLEPPIMSGELNVPAVEALPLAAALRRVTRDVLKTLEWRIPGWLAYWGAVGACFFLWSLAAVVWAYQIYTGLHVTGLLHPVMWGAYITTFVFWVGIAHSGTLISAILFLFRAHWRTTIARVAETMTIVAIMTAGIFPILHLEIGRASC